MYVCIYVFATVIALTGQLTIPTAMFLLHTDAMWTFFPHAKQCEHVAPSLFSLHA